LIVFEWAEQRLARLLRVPPEPDPPPGAASSLRVFRAAPNFYRLNVATWSVVQGVALFGALALLGVTFGFAHVGVTVNDQSYTLVDLVPLALEQIGAVEAADRELPAAAWVILAAELSAVALILVQAPLTFLAVRLNYRMRWYMVTDRSLRIREGVWSLREMTMTFANIQQLTIDQNIVQRLLGIADLKVRTAGGGSAAGEAGGHDSGSAAMHVAWIRGVDRAHEIRSIILDRLRGLKDAGLGDLDEERGAATSSSESPAVLAAAQLLLEEAKLLRTTVSN
jgi:uncharacterized membrane protein YdbT with pleckstrin-like domain